MAKMKQLELLERYRILTKPPRKNPLRSYATPVLLVALLCTTGWYYLREANLAVEAERNAIAAVLEDPANVAAYDEAVEKGNYNAALTADVNTVKLLEERLSRYPLVDSRLLGRIREAGGDKVAVEVNGYESSTGALKFVAKSTEVIDAPQYVLKLQDTGLFETVSYSGYSFDKSLYTLHLECALKAREAAEPEGEEAAP